MKKSIYIFLLTIFLYSCKSLQKPAIVTSKQVAQKTGSYTFTEKTGLEKPAKPTKKELKAIEKAKHEGAVKALKDRIGSLKFNLTNRNWDDITNSSHFTRLGDAISDGKRILEQMQETLEALQELDPDNR